MITRGDTTDDRLSQYKRVTMSSSAGGSAADRFLAYRHVQTPYGNFWFDYFDSVAPMDSFSVTTDTATWALLQYYKYGEHKILEDPDRDNAKGTLWRARGRERAGQIFWNCLYGVVGACPIYYAWYLQTVGHGIMARN